MAGIGANLPVAKNPVGASGRLEDFPVQDAFIRQPVPQPADRGLGLSMQAIGRQLTAMPCERYLIRLIQHATRKALPGERLWTAAQLGDESIVKFLRARNRDGYDVYFQPFVRGGRNAGYILVDLDRIQPAVLDVMFANGHQPCVVAETSPGHLQAWVQVSAQPLAVPVATAIARQLAQLYQADRASADGRHLGRLAGFTNQKPHRRLMTGLAPWVKVRHAALVLASQGPSLVEAATSPSARVRVTFRGPAVARADSRVGLSVREILPESLSPGDAATVYQTWLHRLRILPRFPHPDWSIADLWIAKELIRRGTAAPEVKSILRLASPQFPRGHADPEDYLWRTLARAARELAGATFPARDP